jgi:hypothetical protein
VRIEGILHLDIEDFSSIKETERALEKFFQTLQNETDNEEIAQSDSEDYTCSKYFESEFQTNLSLKQTNNEKETAKKSKLRTQPPENTTYKATKKNEIYRPKKKTKLKRRRLKPILK